MRKRGGAYAMPCGMPRRWLGRPLLAGVGVEEESDITV